MVEFDLEKKKIHKEVLMDYCYGWNIIWTGILFTVSYFLNWIGLDVTRDSVALTFPLWLPFILFIVVNTLTFILTSIVAFFFIAYYSIIDYCKMFVEGWKYGSELARDRK